MQFKDNGIIRLTTAYTPAEGEGARIAPATYAGKEKTEREPGRAQGPAISDGTATMKLDDNGNIITDGRSRSVVIDSIGSQATRSEQALWNCREELSLPGLVLQEGDKAILEEAVRKKIGDSKANIEETIDFDNLVNFFLNTLNIYNDQSSSWTFPHRHVDGIVRFASSTPDGKTEVWTKNKELKKKLLQASPKDLKTLLEIAPNSAVYGYWLSTGAPINYKVSRSYSYDIIGYGASQINYGSTKIDTLPTASKKYYKITDGSLREYGEKEKGAKEASSLLLGSVPSYSTAHITAESILGKGSILLGQLRALVSQDSTLDTAQQEAAFQALAHIALLGHALKEDTWSLRSGCTLIPERTYWTGVYPGQQEEQLEILTVEDLKQETAQAIAKAQNLGVMGNAESRIPLYLSNSLLTVSVAPFIDSLTK